MRATRWANRGERRKVVLLLLALGLAMELVYAATMLVPFFLPTYYATPLLDLGKLTAYGVSAGFNFVIATGALFGLYYAAYRLVHGIETTAPLAAARSSTTFTCGHREGISNARVVTGGGRGYDEAHAYRWPGAIPSLGLIITMFGVLFSATLALVYPYGAADVFDYILYGRMIAYYGANPFLQAPAEFASDPFLPYVAWPHLPFTYGPLWAAFSAALSALGGDALLNNLLLYKGLAIAFYLASLWLISAILRRLAPQYAMAGLLLFAWNPLVVTETAGNGHNDVVMMAFVLLGIRLALAGEARWHPLALAATIASALIKFVTAMLAPLFAASLWREGASPRRRALLLGTGAVAAAALTAVAYAPFWAGRATFAVRQREDLFTASIPALLKLTMEGRMGVSDAKFVGLLFLAAFGLYCLVEAWRLAPGVELLIAASYRVTLIYLLFACLWFQPWYLIWLLALAAIRPGVDIAQQSMLFSFTATMNYFVFDYVWIWNAPGLDFLAVQFISVATIYTLPLAYSLWLLLRGRRWAQRGEVLPSR